MRPAIPPPRPAFPATTAAPWLAKLFGSRSAQSGGVVRRSTAWVEREVGRAAFVAEVRRRGFHLLETGGQFVVICHRGSLRVVC
ncbi:N-(5'-phosphoribosyl)anthranilate isomerase [uncultured Jannaschia sp.]|uniref:N-(5'-phosphoribosyl)anthranilate isomerase n=1 Tax=uncultured Jannaschia sp. TaxID=293347 RepID=UPI002601E95C|nr:N-(5'-phosphoribosyl)anthranilate isomerase [uncultured Jannaschia sp.]